MTEARQFRWKFTDDGIGEQWTGWHNLSGPCPACCCGGPDDGEHQESSEYYDEYDVLTAGHTRLDPTDIDDDLDTVEWKD